MEEEIKSILVFALWAFLTVGLPPSSCVSKFDTINLHAQLIIIYSQYLLEMLLCISNTNICEIPIIFMAPVDEWPTINVHVELPIGISSDCEQDAINFLVLHSKDELENRFIQSNVSGSYESAQIPSCKATRRLAVFLDPLRDITDHRQSSNGIWDFPRVVHCCTLT